MADGDKFLGERVDGTTVLITIDGVIRLANTSGTNTGDQTSIVGITGTKSQFDSAVTDGNILYVGDITQYTDELAQDAVGGMVDSTLVYTDGTPLLQRAALTGDVTASAGSNATTIANDAVTYSKIQNVSATDKLLGRSSSGAGDVEEIACTAAGRALIDDATASDQRTTLGLGTLATQNGTFSGTSSGTNTGDQTSIVGISGTKAQFDTACSDGNFVYQDGLGTNVATFLATPSSANLAAALTDETGSGAAVFATAPSFPTNITVGGNSSAAGIINLLEDSDNGTNKLILTPPQSIASDKTVTFQDVTGTVYVSGGTDVAVADGGTGTSSAGIGAFNNITGYTAAGATGTTSTNLVFSTSPTLVTPTLGVASATSINFGQDALNYYDEGTFTPEFTFATPGDLSVVYSNQTGVYTRVGNIVNIQILIGVTPTYTTSAGAVNITGMPFTANATVIGILTNSSTFAYPASRTWIAGQIAASATILTINGMGSAAGATGLSVTQFPTGVSHTFRVQMSYLV